MGHDGATAGTLTEPTGPAVDLADQLKNVDVFIGDHTDFQVVSRRPTARSSWRTAARACASPGSGSSSTTTGREGVVYSTADYHKPWNIGVTPNAAIQAEIDALNAQLARSSTRRSGPRAS